LGINRSSLYYEPAELDKETLSLMNEIDRQYTKTPFYGSRRMTEHLRRQGHRINRKRVQRLMERMGLEAVFPGPNTSRRAQEHRIYPYLLKGLEITRPNQVWSTDITYIRLWQGFLYLVAIMDWYSRFVLAWRLSNSLDSSFCVEALEAAFLFGEPDIFNTDQGAQFTSLDFTGRLLDRRIAISMDSRGRALDNVFIERLWRSVKYEEVYLNDYRSVADAQGGIGRYFDFYNAGRFHQALGYRTPQEVHFDGRN
jgi:putative transposase